ncbi:MAG: pyridoxamine 5'-phosphate oxidase family protein [Salinigranum sp.]
MALERETELTTDELNQFLSERETGVLSFARDDEPYAIPISYGYDASEPRFYLRLVSTPDSEKRRFLSSSPHVRLVVYEPDDPIYRSAIAAGALTEVTMDDLSVEHIEQYGRAKRPLFEIWAESRSEVDVKLYELAPDELSGRRVKIDRDST